jgi:predicted ATPase
MDIRIKIENYRCFSAEHPVEVTLGSGFTAFVGVNNSGKSTILRMFFELRQMFILLTTDQGFSQALNKLTAFNATSNASSHTEWANTDNEKDIKLTISVSFDEYQQIDGATQPTPDVHYEIAEKLVLTLPRGQNTCKGEVFIVGGQYNAYTSGNVSAGMFKAEGLANPIAVMHLVRACGTLARTFYVGPFRNILSVKPDASYFDLDIGKSFIEKWHSDKTGGNRSQADQATRLTLDLARIFNFKKLEINSAHGNSSMRFVIDDRTFELWEMGSGIAQFLVVLANVLMHKPDLVLIDEPELHLHPSLQLDFLRTLASYATTGVVFATHNIGLAREMGDRVFSIRVKERDHHIAPLGQTPLTEFLGEMGYSAYKELGYEKLLLVEGVSELRAIRELFYKYGDLNQRYVMIHMGGNNLINARSEDEFKEILRICDDVSVLIDSEREVLGGPPQEGRDDFVKMCKELGIECHMLERRSLENYFTDAAVRAVLGDRARALGHFDKAPKPWKRHNWKIVQKMSRDEFEHTDLGKFITGLAN